MSKDRYSSTHTIQVVGGDETINLGRNVFVQGDLEVGDDVEITGDLVAGSLGTTSGDVDFAGSLTVGNDIIATDNVEANNFIYNATKQIVRWIPLSVISHSILATTTSGLNTPASGGGESDGSGTISDYPTVILGHSSSPGWHIYIPVDPFIPHGASIAEVVFYVENFTITAPNNVDFQVDVESFNAAGSSSSFTVLGTDTAQLIGLTNIRVALRFDVDTAAINQDILTADCVRIKFAQTDAAEANVISIFKFGLVLNIESVDQGLGLI